MFQPKHLALVALLAVGTASASNVRVHVAHEHRQAARAAHAKTHHSQTKSWWDPTNTTCSDGGQSVSVVGWPEPGCIDKGVQMCVATYSDGACPDGAECAWLSYDSTGASVYGCKPAQWHDCSETEATCADGEISVSVVGWEEPGCVYDDPDYDDDICVASYYWGVCPEGSACGFVTYDANDDPVYGCYAMDLTEDGDTCVPVSVVGWEYSGCIDSEDNMCVADNSEGECPDGSSCAVVQWDDSWNPSVWGCVDDYFYDYDDTECHSVQAPCDEGYDEIGVVGWSANGCVPSGSDVCVADIYDGTCPEYSECWPVNYDDEGYYVWGCVATWDDSSSYKRLHHKKQSPVAKKNHSKQHSHGKKHKKHSHKKHSHKKHSHKH